MKISFVTASLSREAGGLFESVRRLAQGMADEWHDVSVFGVEDRHTLQDIGVWRPHKVKAFRVYGPRKLSYAPELYRAILAEGGDLLMSHGLWRYTSFATHGWHQRSRGPYVVHPHGMLDPWAVRNSRWKKQVAAWLYERSHLSHASCIRALCESEASSIRAYGLSNPICVIPNGVDIPQASLDQSEKPPPWQGIVDPQTRILLYLGRIHPKKGLKNLIAGWRSSRTSKVNSSRRLARWALVIAGWDQDSHELELKGLASELGIGWVDTRERPTTGVTERSASLLFVGPQFGEDKVACFRHCTAFVLPSLSEGVPMAVLEAWAHAKPALMTPACNLPEGFACGAAFEIEPNAESIAGGLGMLTSATRACLDSAGICGRKLVSERFVWTEIGKAMRSVCEWVLGAGPPPRCVRLE